MRRSAELTGGNGTKTKTKTPPPCVCDCGRRIRVAPTVFASGPHHMRPVRHRLHSRGGPVVIDHPALDLDATDACPLDERCENCDASTDLDVATAGTPVGIYLGYSRRRSRSRLWGCRRTGKCP